MAKKPTIGRAELEVLQYIQDRHPVTVREVADHIGQTKGVVRTTVLNVMNRLCRKGYLTRRKVGAVYQYVPRQQKGEMLRTLVRDFVEKALGGSVSPFVAYLAEDATLSDEELNQLRQAVRELAQQGKEPSR